MRVRKRGGGFQEEKNDWERLGGIAHAHLLCTGYIFGLLSCLHGVVVGGLLTDRAVFLCGGKGGTKLNYY